MPQLELFWSDFLLCQQSVIIKMKLHHNIVTPELSQRTNGHISTSSSSNSCPRPQHSLSQSYRKMNKIGLSSNSAFSKFSPVTASSSKGLKGSQSILMNGQLHRNIVNRFLDLDCDVDEFFLDSPSSIYIKDRNHDHKDNHNKD